MAIYALTRKTIFVHDLLVGLSLRGLGAVASFGLTWITAQLYGVKPLGLYQMAFATAGLVASLSIMGQEVVIIRQLTPLVHKQMWAEVRARFRGTMRAVAINGWVLALVSAIIIAPLAAFLIGEPDLLPFMIALSPFVVLFPMIRINSALLRCLGRVKLSQSLEGVLYTTLAVVGLFVLWVMGVETSPLTVPFFLIMGLLVSFWVARQLAAAQMRDWPSDQPSMKADLKSGRWIAAAPLVASTSNWLLLLLVGGMLGPAEAGIFRTAVMICMLMELINTSFVAMAGPHLAKAAAEGALRAIRKLVLIAGAVGLALAAPLAFVIIAYPHFLLGLFGTEFMVGARSLQWIALAQTLNIAAGPVGAALIMQKRERLVLGIEICAATLGVVTSLVLIPYIGMEGAALGMMAAIIARNAANAAAVWAMPAKQAGAI